jgi:hypothetical protein
MKSKSLATTGEPAKVSTHDLNGMDGWAELERSEQDLIRAETHKLDDALIAAGNARLAVGEHLYNVQEVLKPKRMFNKYLVALNWTSRASAYRYIDLYTAAKTILPAPVLEQAMLRGIDRFSLKKIEDNPVPAKTANVVVINEYLDTITAVTPQVPSTDADVLKREVFNFFDTRFQRLPAAGRSRHSFALFIAGIILSRAGFDSAQSIKPIPIPAAFVHKRLAKTG